MKQSVRDKLSKDPRMNQCLVCNSPQVEWNHAYQGKLRDEACIIQPLCVEHHRGNFGTITLQGDILSKLNALKIGKKELTKIMGKDWWESEWRKQNYRKSTWEESLKAKLNGYI